MNAVFTGPGRVRVRNTEVEVSVVLADIADGRPLARGETVSFGLVSGRLGWRAVDVRRE